MRTCFFNLVPFCCRTLAMEYECGAGPPKAELRELNHLITCKICKGYFIDATTITECLHTCKLNNSLCFKFVFLGKSPSVADDFLPFSVCRSCIVKHFKKSLRCPECEVQVETGCPLNKLRCVVCLRVILTRASHQLTILFIKLFSLITGPTLENNFWSTKLCQGYTKMKLQDSGIS